jgi:hypothetical protein
MLAAMKKIMAALALAAAFAVPAAAAERTYSVTDFDRVSIEGPFTVRLTSGRPAAASATGSQHALDRISIAVESGVLRIRPNRSAWSGDPGAASGPVAIEISTRALRAATVLGAGSLAIDRASGMRVDLTVEGSGRIAVPTVAVDRLVVGMIGSGRIQIAGTAADLRASVHGWADLDAGALRAQAAQIVTDTAGRIAVGVERQATVTASGIGEVDIVGAPACTLRGLSAAQVRCGGGPRR